MPSKVQKGESILRPRARLIKTIGEELISSDIVAVLELVKNSYDADATIIEITFSGEVIEIEEGSKKRKKRVLKKNGGLIDIIDDGTGMTFDVVQGAWMEPATIMKKLNKKSSSRSRRHTGEKGIGRFASAKLSETLKMITKSENENEIVVDFDWSDFSDESYLDEIKCHWEVREPEVINERGTILNLRELNTDWDEEKFRSLRITLSRLINPVAPIEDFLIELILPEDLSDLSGLVDAPDSINKPDYLIKGEVDKNGKAKLNYSSKNQATPITYLKDLQKQLKPIRKPKSGPFQFEFRVWDRENDSLKRLAKEIGSTVKNIRSDLDDLAGISIYRDYFRVLPYGEPNNDWLRLDLRRVNNPTLRLSGNQIVGYVSISLDKNPEFKDQSNREGIVESQAFNDLKEMIKAILNELEIKRYEERPRKKSEETSKESLFAQFSIAPIKNVIAKKLPKDNQVSKVIKDTETKIDEGIEKVQNVISRYRRLSTLGLLIDVILHDGNNFLLNIDSETRLLEKELSKEESDINLVKKHLKAIKDQRKILAQLFKRLEPFGGRKRGRPKDIVLEQSIKSVFELYSTEIEKLSIQIDLPDSRNLVRIDEGELQMILVNLLQNSIYWLSQQEEDRRITVLVEFTDDELSLTFSDSGPGIKDNHNKLIFDPYFSTKPDGIGLGLTIVGELISEYDGDFVLVEKGPLNGATFKIIFRRRV